MLPNFLIVGAARCGTTYLDRLLRQHPQVYLPPGQKELNFFTHEPAIIKAQLHNYRTYYEQVDGQPAVGEISPSTMLFETAAQGIANHLDQVRLIFLLRNPVNRAYSDYHLQISMGREYLTFPDALKVEAERVQKNRVARLHYSYAGRGFYMRQIEGFLDIFPPENMHFMISENFYEDPAGELARLCRFLGIDENFPFELEVLRYHALLPRFNKLYRTLVWMRIKGANTRGLSRLARLAFKIFNMIPKVNQPYPPLPDHIYQGLQARFATDKKALASFLATDLSQWW